MKNITNGILDNFKTQNDMDMMCVFNMVLLEYVWTFKYGQTGGEVLMIILTEDTIISKLNMRVTMLII